MPIPSDYQFPEIDISVDDSFAAARKLKNCLVMNFDSATNPGGGFLSGANAQEENLCRESTLYKSLESDEADNMYAYNNRHRNPCKYNMFITAAYFEKIVFAILDRGEKKNLKALKNVFSEPPFLKFWIL